MNNVIDLTDDSPPPPPAPMIACEPIGVDVTVDILDLTEGHSDHEQNLHSVPQHLDWNDIAEQRAAHSAFQALISNSTVPPPPQPLVGRQQPPFQRGKNSSKKWKNKGKKRQSQQSAGESSSSQRQNKRLKKSCNPNADIDAPTKNTNGRTQPAKKHPKKRRGRHSKKAAQVPKKAPENDAKETEAEAALRKREQKRRKNQRHRKNLAARKRAKEEAKREESEKKISTEGDSQSGSIGAKTSGSDDNLARKPSAASYNDEKLSPVQSESQLAQELTLLTDNSEERMEKKESLPEKWAPKPPPAISQLNVGNRSPQNVQVATQHRESEMSCFSATAKSDTVVETTRESVTDPSRIRHDAALKPSPDLSRHSKSQELENSVDSSGANVSTTFKSDSIVATLDDTDSETDVDSQSGNSLHLDKEEAASSSINERDENKKSLPAEVDHKIQESRDVPNILDESQTLPVQKASPREESHIEQNVEEMIDVGEKKNDQLEHSHVSLSEIHLCRDKVYGNDESSMKNASTSIRTGEKSPSKNNGAIGRRQDSDHRTASTGTATAFTNPEVIDVDDVESEKGQNETNVVPPSKPASSLKSLPAKKQSQTASSSRPVAAGMKETPTLKDLIVTNIGDRDKKRAKPKKHCGTKKKTAGSQGERKSWQSTVIIVETSDEEESDSHDTDETTEQGAEVEFLKTASPPKKRRRRGRPTNPATKFKKYPPKREPLEQHLRTNGQYNFNYTQEEAAREQERLFKEAADRLRQNASIPNQSTGTAATSVPLHANDLNHEHWRSPDLYHRLGLPPGAPIQHVKRQYRRLALRYHPDKGWKDVHTTDRFQAITEAYKVLCGECERL